MAPPVAATFTDAVLPEVRGNPVRLIVKIADDYLPAPVVRAVVEPLGDGHGIVLGAAWRRDCGIAPGDEVAVVLVPEGPQRADLSPDVAAALDAEPAAGAFFDSIAQFYRNAYLRWIDATKRSPAKRAARIAEMVGLLKAGTKERPRG